MSLAQFDKGECSSFGDEGLGFIDSALFEKCSTQTCKKWGTQLTCKRSKIRSGSCIIDIVDMW